MKVSSLRPAGRMFCKLHSIAAKFWGAMLVFPSTGFVQLCETIGDGCRFPASIITVSLSGKVACRLKTPRIGAEEARTMSDDGRASGAKSAHHLTYQIRQNPEVARYAWVPSGAVVMSRMNC